MGLKQFPQTVQSLLTVFIPNLLIYIHISFFIKYSPKVSTRFLTFKSLTFDHNYFNCVSSPLDLPMYIFSLWNVYLHSVFSITLQTDLQLGHDWTVMEQTNNVTVICVYYSGTLSKSALTHFCFQNKQRHCRGKKALLFWYHFPSLSVSSWLESPRSTNVPVITSSKWFSKPEIKA